MKRISSFFLLLSILLSLAAPVFATGDTAPDETEGTAVAAENAGDTTSAESAPVSVTEETIVIHNAQELYSLAEKCTLDTWSYGKTVVLANDIDLAGTAYTSIPVFSGTFDGGGHTIRNLKIDCSGSSLGFIRHVGRGGQIKNLTVTGSVAPDGIRE